MHLPAIFRGWARQIGSERGVLCVVLGVMGFRILRAYWLHLEAPLAPDVASYRALASVMEHPWDTGSRESLWIWYVRFCVFLFGDSDSAMRWAGMALFFPTGLLFYRLVRALSGDRWVAALALFIFGNSGLMLYLFVNTTRDTLFLFAFLLLAYFVFVPKVSYRNRLWGLTLAAVLAVGCRVTILFPLLLVLGFTSFRYRLNWRGVVLPLGAALVVMGPFLIYSYQTTGDPFHAANVHAVWWRNHEFVSVRGIGCEGCPTLEEMKARGNYVGAPVTWAQYIFGMHSFSELAFGFVVGCGHLLALQGPLLRSLSGVLNFPMFVAYLLGWGLLLLSPRREVVLLPFLVTNVLIFMLPSIGMPPRLFTPFAPLMMTCLALGTVFSVRGCLNLLRRHSHFRRWVPSEVTP